jgi:hypothetical protein
MHADMDETVHMKIEGPMAKLLVNIDPKLYEPYLTHENGKPVIYVELAKAQYGTLQAARLFWQNLSSFLIAEGFEMNPYDECVVNKIINGKQCTMVWHVDDLKISHVEEQVTQEIVSLLQKKYGSADAPVTVSYGKVHDYLGMTLDYSANGKVTIDMREYVKEVLDSAPADMREGIAATPAAAHLYEVKMDGVDDQLDKDMAEQFHTFTAKLLFLSKRSCPDLQ